MALWEALRRAHLRPKIDGFSQLYVGIDHSHSRHRLTTYYHCAWNACFEQCSLAFEMRTRTI